MRVPEYWREMPTNMNFSGEEKGNSKRGLTVFKYPGGSIPLVGDYDEIYSRFEEKGFAPEVIEEVLLSLFGAVSSESTISVGEILESV